MPARVEIDDAKFIALHRDGLSHREIADRLGVSQTLVSKRLRAHGITGYRGRGEGLRDWRPIFERAAEITRSFVSATLRQVHYVLVGEGIGYANTLADYSYLSVRTAIMRRAGHFPAFIDTTREIDVQRGWDSPEEAVRSIAYAYRRDRTEGQDVALYIASEKRTMGAQLRAWYGKRSIPVLALGGSPSQTYIDEIAEDIDVYADGRDVRIVYAGDFDASGISIGRDFERRLREAGAVFEFERVALWPEQIDKYALIENTGKPKDTNRAAFVAEFGRDIQVEIEALPPDVLHGLYDAAIEPYWNEDVYAAVLKREATERERLVALSTKGDT